MARKEFQILNRLQRNTTQGPTTSSQERLMRNTDSDQQPSATPRSEKEVGASKETMIATLNMTITLRNPDTAEESTEGTEKSEEKIYNKTRRKRIQLEK